MIKAYINYKDPSITIHRFATCDQARVGPKEKIRHVFLSPDSLSKELDRFESNKHRFDDEPYMDDMWLIFDFQDVEFEVALLKYLKKLMGLSNSIMKDCTILEHC